MDNSNQKTIPAFRTGGLEFESDDSILSFKDLFIPYGNSITVKKGEKLFAVGGEPPKSVYYIKKGTIKLSQVTLAGTEQIFNYYRAGETIFIMAAILNDSPSLDFTVTETAELLEISAERFLSMMYSDQRVANIVIDELATRLDTIHRRHREAESYSTEWKACNMLLSFAERSGIEYDGKILIREKVSQQEMAGLLRVSRITIARILKDLRNYGLIETINGYICIRDEAKLKQHMYYISLPLE